MQKTSNTVTQIVYQAHKVSLSLIQTNKKPQSKLMLSCPSSHSMCCECVGVLTSVRCTQLLDHPM